MASSKTIKDDELVEGPILANPEADDEAAVHATYFTLTEVDSWVYARDEESQERVQVTPITLPREMQRVTRNNGVLFLEYNDAINLAHAANLRATEDGRLAGHWSSKTIGARRIYVPLREAVA